MTVLFLVLLGIIVASTLLFGIFLIRQSLEDADFWLKVCSAVLASLIFAVGLAALITGHFSGQTQAEKILILETAKAEAETKLEELKRRQDPRILIKDKFVNALNGKPKGMVILMYPKDNEEAWSLALGFHTALLEAGWQSPLPQPIGEEIANPKLSRFPPSFFPPALRAGGGSWTGINVVTNRPPDFDIFSDPVLIAFLRALSEGGFGSVMSLDPSLPDNTFRVIVGPKP